MDVSQAADHKSTDAEETEVDSPLGYPEPYEQLHLLLEDDKVL